MKASHLNLEVPFQLGYDLVFGGREKNFNRFWLFNESRRFSRALPAEVIDRIQNSLVRVCGLP